MAQIGTDHGHAAGKWKAIQTNPDVEAVAIWETDQAAEALADPSVVAIAVEPRNHLSLAVAEAAIAAGKHIWFDKPAGDDFAKFARLLDQAAERGLQVQMGYMFRYNPAFATVAEWARSGMLGDLFAVRAHMSTSVDLAERTPAEPPSGRDSVRPGRPHDRPDRVVTRSADTRFEHPAERRHAGAANVRRQHAGQLRVRVGAGQSGDRGRGAAADGAPLRSVRHARQCHPRAVRPVAHHPPDPGRGVGRYPAGETIIELPLVTRQEFYERELAAFVRVLRGEQPADRPAAHELLVQETLLRATGSLA